MNSPQSDLGVSFVSVAECWQWNYASVYKFDSTMKAFFQCMDVCTPEFPYVDGIWACPCSRNGNIIMSLDGGKSIQNMLVLLSSSGNKINNKIVAFT